MKSTLSSTYQMIKVVRTNLNVFKNVSVASQGLKYVRSILLHYSAVEHIKYLLQNNMVYPSQGSATSRVPHNYFFASVHRFDHKFKTASSRWSMHLFLENAPWYKETWSLSKLQLIFYLFSSFTSERNHKKLTFLKLYCFGFSFDLQLCC